MYKIAPNTSKVLTDQEWKYFWTCGKKYYSSLEDYEKNIEQERQRQEIFSKLLSEPKPLVDKIWR